MSRRSLLLRALLAFVVVDLIVAGAAVYLLFVAPRPADTTDAAVFADDGAELDYCELPALDGTGKVAAQIPKAFTPGCGWTTWPMPVLENCTEPLPAGVADLRGLWRGRVGDRDHVERVEQCGNRVVVTTAGIIHDFVADGTLRNGSRDIEPPRCMNTYVAIDWRDGALSFRPFGLPFVAVTRRRDGADLMWKYPGNEEARLERICRVPESHREDPYRGNAR